MEGSELAGATWLLGMRGSHGGSCRIDADNQDRDVGLSALHRNPALTAKIAATLDEIAEGRFIFGLGAGHAAGQGRSFGFPDGHTVSRYEEALEIIVPALRGQEVTFAGDYHSAHELVNRPIGPSGTDIPLMLAGHGPRNIATAVRYADIWSAYATDDSRPEAFLDRLKLLEAECEKQGRDLSTLKKSIGVVLEPPDSPVRAEDVGLGVPLRGSVDDVAEVFAQFASLGVDALEVTAFPENESGLALLGEVTARLDQTS